ncbi:MAG TPA: hypothetical protein VEA16_11190 [Vicinamibacterales bacterium]|nr:hypothetical protein [Vicinamibacterales bacterium]
MWRLPRSANLLAADAWRDIEALRCAMPTHFRGRSLTEFLADERGFATFSMQAGVLGRGMLQALPIEYVLVGGAGAAGRDGGAGSTGGGGGGGDVSGTLTAILQPGASLLATIGAAGVFNDGNTTGGTTTFGSLGSAIGGGHGAANTGAGNVETGSNGASGGGGGFIVGNHGAGGTGSTGGNGGNSVGNGSGGGGGDGGAGSNSSADDGGAGGPGTSNSITGSAVFYGAGGGGGGAGAGAGGVGGSAGAGGAGGGGGAGGVSATTFGSGGGGVGENGGVSVGQSKAGVIFARYVGASPRATGGLISTITVSGVPYQLHEFNITHTGSSFVVLSL